MSYEFPEVPQHKAPEALQPDDLKGIVERVENNDRLTYYELQKFLSTPLEPREPGRLLPLLYSSALFASSVGVSSLVEIHRESLPSFGKLPEQANTVLNSMYEHYPFGAGEAESAAFRDHLPKLYLGGAIGLAVMELWRVFDERRSNRDLRERAADAQQKLELQSQKGSVRWQIAQDATVAFVGAGDRLTQDLARNRTGDVVQIGFERPAEVAWTYLPKVTTYGAVIEALDKAHFENAGELLIMPTKTLDVFLPQDGDHDISLDRTVNYIKAAMDFCDQRGIPRKPVLVVGNEFQSETYTTTEYTGDKGTSETITLKERMDNLTRELSCEGKPCKITTIDPTKVVMERIAEIASGRRVLFRATSGSQEMYGKAFYEQYNNYAIPSDPTLEPMVVTYNNNDWPTAGYAALSDIAVIIDSTQKESLLKMGTKHVLVVSELTLEAAAPIIQPAT